MRKEENTLIGWEFIEYLDPEISLLARRDEISLTLPKNLLMIKS